MHNVTARTMCRHGTGETGDIYDVGGRGWRGGGGGVNGTALCQRM